MTERLTLCNALAKPADSAISNHRDSKPKEPMKIDRDHIFIDLETTGLDPSTGDIIEVAAIRTDNVGNLIATYSDKITPKVPVTIEASRVNGYTEEKWAQAISIEAAMATMTASILTGGTLNSSSSLTSRTSIRHTSNRFVRGIIYRCRSTEVSGSVPDNWHGPCTTPGL